MSLAPREQRSIGVRIILAGVVMLILTLLAGCMFILPGLDHKQPSAPDRYYFSSWRLGAAIVSWLTAVALIGFLIKKLRRNIILAIPPIWFAIYSMLWVSAIEDYDNPDIDPHPCRLENRITIQSAVPDSIGQPTFTWCVDFGDDEVNNPIISNDLMIIRRGDHRLVALDLKTGHERWSAKATSTFGIHRLADHIVYVADGDQLIALDRTSGSTVWQRDLLAATHTAPIVGQHLIYVTSPTGNIEAFDRATGEPIWQSRTDVTQPFSRAVEFNGDTFVLFGRGVLLGLDATSGLEQWRQSWPDDYVSTWVVGPNVAINHIKGDAFVVVDLETRAERWRFENAGGIVSGPIIVGDRVIVGTSHGRMNDRHKGSILALDIATGSIQWQTNFDAGVRNVWGSGEHIYAQTDDHSIHILDFPTGENVSLSPPVFYQSDYCHLSMAIDRAALIGCSAITALDRASGSLSWSIRLDSLVSFIPDLETPSGNTLFFETYHGIYRVDVPPTRPSTSVPSTPVS